MGAEFYVANCSPAGGIGLNVNGNVTYGEIREGGMGRTFRGKRFTLVKIIRQGIKVARAFENDQVNLFLKNVSRNDLKGGEVIYFD